MTRLYFLLFVFFLPSCGIVHNTAESIADDSNNDILFFEINEYIVQLLQNVMEGEARCPRLELLSKDKKQVLDSLDLCLVKISGYRDFDVTKDFSFIDFIDFQLKNGRIYYDIDLAILRGSAFLVNCDIRIQEQRLIQGDCKKIDAFK